MKRHYGAPGTIVAAAGRVDHDAFVTQVASLFGGMDATDGAPPATGRYVGGDCRVERPLEQLHVVLGFEGVGYRDPDYYALGVLSAYHFALNVVQLPLVEARTVATSVLVLVGLYFVLVLESAGTRRRRNAVAALCAAMLLLYVLTLSLAGMRDFFDLVVPGFWSLVAIALGTSLTITGLVFTDDRFVADLGVKPFAR